MAHPPAGSAAVAAAHFDWNLAGSPLRLPATVVMVHDETLRDGIQSPSVTDPCIDEKLAVVRLLDGLGVESCDVGLPGAGPRAVADARVLLQAIVDEGLQIRPACAARTHVNDIQPIIALAEEVGVPIEVMAFLGTSPIRKLAEHWDDALLESRTRAAVRMTVQAGLPICFVTEDTVRSHPRTLRRLFSAAIEEGAARLCLCDTVGHSDPRGVRRLIAWTEGLLTELEADIGIDWHGHNDRGFGLINALVAMQSGASRIHGTVLGVGERVGNTPLDLLLVNLQRLGQHDRDLSTLAQLVDLVSRALEVPLPPHYPVFGPDAAKAEASHD